VQNENTQHGVDPIRENRLHGTPPFLQRRTDDLGTRCCDRRWRWSRLRRSSQGAGGSGDDSDSDLAGSQAGDGDLGVDVDGDDAPDLTISMGGDLDEDRSCEVLEINRFLEIVPEVEELTLNTTVSFGENSCSYQAPRQTGYYLTVYPDGGDPADVIEQNFGVDDSSEVRGIDSGAALWRDNNRIEAIAVEADGAVVVLQQSGVNFIPVETWEGPLAAYLAERLAATYG